MYLPDYLIATLLGLSFGSFLTVVVARLPGRRSLVHPRSCCPACGHRLAWYDLLPVLSYLLLRGRCRHCRGVISPSYPLLEVGTALLFAAALHTSGWSLQGARLCAVALVLLAAAEIDRRHGIIPNALVGVAALTGLGLGAGEGLGFLLSALPAAGVSAALLLGLRIASSRAFGHAGFGMGDVKLTAATALFLGWDNLWLFYLAAVLGGAFGLAGLWTGRLERRARLPFAPFVAAALPVHLLWLPPETFLLP